MPQTAAQRSSALFVKLHQHNDFTFAPGDTILGCVARNAGIVAPTAAVSIRLMGRAKVKITIRRSNGQGTTVHRYRSRYHFFSSNAQQCSGELYRGPLHIEKQNAPTHSWEFAIPIPTSTGLSPYVDTSQGNSYLPLQADDVQHHALPPSYFSSGRHFGGKSSECFVEYYLQASLHFQHGGSSETVESILPIRMIAPAQASPLNDVRLKPVQWKDTRSDYRFVPGMESEKLSLKQKSKAFFGASSVPHICIAAKLNVPTCLQLDHIGWFPLTIRIRTVRSHTSEILHGVPQKAMLHWVKMSVVTEAAVVAGGTFSDKHDTNDHTIDLGLERAFYALRKPILLEISEEAEEIPLGDILQLRLTRYGLYAGENKLSTGGVSHVLTPDFTTYNIKCTHHFKYTVSVTVGGKTYEEKFHTAGQLIPRPARSAIEPPPPPMDGPGPSQAFEQPPPAFEDVVGEGSALSAQHVASDTKAPIKYEAEKA